MNEDTIRSVAGEKLWTEWTRIRTWFDIDSPSRTVPDALIAKLAAAVEELKCCGNCSAHLDDHCVMPEPYLIEPCYEADPCHFTPSRWKERTE